MLVYQRVPIMGWIRVLNSEQQKSNLDDLDGWLSAILTWKPEKSLRKNMKKQGTLEPFPKSPRKWIILLPETQPWKFRRERWGSSWNFYMKPPSFFQEEWDFCHEQTRLLWKKGDPVPRHAIQRSYELWTTYWDVLRTITPKYLADKHGIVFIWFHDFNIGCTSLTMYLNNVDTDNAYIVCISFKHI